MPSDDFIEQTAVFVEHTLIHTDLVWHPFSVWNFTESKIALYRKCSICCFKYQQFWHAFNWKTNRLKMRIRAISFYFWHFAQKILFIYKIYSISVWTDFCLFSALFLLFMISICKYLEQFVYGLLSYDWFDYIHWIYVHWVWNVCSNKWIIEDDFSFFLMLVHIDIFVIFIENSSMLLFTIKITHVPRRTVDWEYKE